MKEPLPATERSVRIDVDLSAGPVDLAGLEAAAVDSPAAPVAS